MRRLAPQAASKASIARLSLSNLAVRMNIADEELKLELKLASISLAVAASPFAAQPAQPSASILVLKGETPVDSKGFLELGVECVKPGARQCVAQARAPAWLPICACA